MTNRAIAEAWWNKDAEMHEHASEDEIESVERLLNEAETRGHAAGVAAGMARAGNYVADSADSPVVITFANGTRVKISGDHLIVERSHEWAS